MHDRLRVVATILTIALFIPALSFGQGQSGNAPEVDPGWEMPRMPNGQPNLQGYWTTQTFTPMERPEYLGDQAFYSEEEWAQLQAQLTVDGADPLARHVITLADSDEREKVLNQTYRDETYVHYDNAIWLATRVPKGLSTRRTSLVTDPANGRIPPRNAQAQARADARRAARGNRGPFDGYELRPLSERCIYYGYNGPPLQNPSYNDIHQIFQNSDHVVIFTEQNNNPPRIIPVDGRPEISEDIRQYPGDSRGYWDGDTLVVESNHFNDSTAWQGSSRDLKVVERFTRIADDRIHYEFTVEDPNTWDQPWSAEIPMMATEGPMYEYACHEGNHDIKHIQEVYRNIELQEAKKTQ
ncbi:MAG: hypothetical protein CL484_03870 [Acidobacteria bacterium]|nr:hypothetical protein [Acidobacteriota bacterium]